MTNQTDAEHQITTMIAKYDIEYIVFPEHNTKVSTHRTDDPVAAEEFLMHLLVSGARLHNIKHEGSGARLHNIKHEGVALERVQQDGMLRAAAERLCTHLISRAVHIDTAETKHRFGFAA